VNQTFRGSDAWVLDATKTQGTEICAFWQKNSRITKAWRERGEKVPKFLLASLRLKRNKLWDGQGNFPGVEEN